MPVLSLIVLQNYFARCATKFSIQEFESNARLIHAAVLLDSIISHWTHVADFCNTIGSEPDLHTNRLIVA